LIAFIARHNPLAILPVSVLVGGLAASGGMLQRRLDLPDATVLVLQGLAFVTILGSEALYGRLSVFQPRAQTEPVASPCSGGAECRWPCSPAPRAAARRSSS